MFASVHQRASARHFSSVDNVGLEITHRRPRLASECLPLSSAETQEKLFEIRSGHCDAGYYRFGQSDAIGYDRFGQLPNR